MQSLVTLLFTFSLAMAINVEPI